MRVLLTIVCVIFVVSRVAGQTEDKVLTQKLRKLTDGFRGDVGIFVQHIPSGRYAAINADSLFPTASMIKIPITIGVFDRIESGALHLHDELIYKDSLLYEGVDLLGSFRNGEKIELGKLLLLTITMSDNTASLWCQSLAGGGAAINSWLADNGFNYTRVNSRTHGREHQRSLYGWGQTTPREMAQLVVRIREGKVISARASERIYRNLTRIYWDSEALSQIPPYVQVASKQGAVNRSRSEGALVNAPGGDYVFCVITKNQLDESWHPDNEGFTLLRDVSALLWKYFEPRNKWKPANGMADWR